MLKNIVVLCMTIVSAKAQRPYDEAWHRRWFPHSPTEQDTNVVVNDGKNLNDVHHGIAMGVVDSSCDDGKTKLQIDWFNNEENYTCFENRSLFLPKATVHPIDSVEHIPEAYNAQHKCMNESITYNEIIPTFGTHRPLWAVYGEYIFLPKHRWLHNLEHGAIAMLYHPCANKNEINILKNLVKSCLYRHVITPYNLLSSTRPLALVSWGHRLEMSKVAPAVVIDFIKKHALRGPEKTHKNGQYAHGLKESAHEVSDMDDQILCPKLSGDGIEMKPKSMQPFSYELITCQVAAERLKKPIYFGRDLKPTVWPFIMRPGMGLHPLQLYRTDKAPMRPRRPSHSPDLMPVTFFSFVFLTPTLPDHAGCQTKV